MNKVTIPKFAHLNTGRKVEGRQQDLGIRTFFPLAMIPRRYQLQEYIEEQQTSVPYPILLTPSLFFYKTVQHAYQRSEIVRLS